MYLKVRPVPFMLLLYPPAAAAILPCWSMPHCCLYPFNSIIIKIINIITLITVMIIISFIVVIAAKHHHHHHQRILLRCSGRFVATNLTIGSNSFENLTNKRNFTTSVSTAQLYQTKSICRNITQFFIFLLSLLLSLTSSKRFLCSTILMQVCIGAWQPFAECEVIKLGINFLPLFLWPVRIIGVDKFVG